MIISNKKTRTTTIQALVAMLAIAGSSAASATLLTTEINIDNGFSAYISTSDSTAGTLFGSGNNWQISYNNSVTLNSGVDYYLHIYGYDQGGIAGFLGEFNLTGSDHQFANNLTSLLTNTTDWVGNISGFNGAYGTLTDLGANGVGPWGTQSAIPTSAHWIWSGDATNNNVSYFSTKISAVQTVPEPESIALVGLGLFLASLRRRKLVSPKSN